MRPLIMLTEPPFYGSGDMLEMPMGLDDLRIVVDKEPQVNRVSKKLKNIASGITAALARSGMKIIQAGIGDSLDGPTLREVLVGLNLAVGHEVISVKQLEAIMNLDVIVHFEYGPMDGRSNIISGMKAHIEKVLGIRAENYVTLGYGGRTNIMLMLKAFDQFARVMMRELGCADLNYGIPGVVSPGPTWGTNEDITKWGLDPRAFFRFDCSPWGLIDPDKFDAFCAERPWIRYVLYNDPVNPTGLQYSPDHAMELGRIVAKHKLLQLGDTIYGSMCFTAPHCSPLRAAALLHANGGSDAEAGLWCWYHTAVSIGWGKFGKSGLRGYPMVIPSVRLRERVVAVQGALLGPPNAFTQGVDLATLEGGGDVRSWHAINNRRPALHEALCVLSETVKPYGVDFEWSGLDAAFYTWGRFNGLTRPLQWTEKAHDNEVGAGEIFCELLLRNGGLIGSPDCAALTEDPNAFRISFGMMNRDSIELIKTQVVPAFVRVLEASGYEKLSNGDDHALSEFAAVNELEA